MSYIHSTHHTLLILIGFFYFTLGNLMPRYRSSLSAIQLLGIVKRSIMIEYGMNAILQPFINDIKKLVCEITSCTLLFCYGQSGGTAFLGTIHGVTIPFCCYARSLGTHSTSKAVPSLYMELWQQCRQIIWEAMPLEGLRRAAVH